MKLHRHRRRIDGREYTVITPRPRTEVCYSTEEIALGWRVFTNVRGARFLARLMWGLSYHRRPNTVVLLAPPFIDVHPWTGERSTPILLARGPGAAVSDRVCRELRRSPPRGAGEGTVRWHTPGLRRPHAGYAENYRTEPVDYSIAERGGVLVLSAAAARLRDWAQGIGFHPVRSAMHSHVHLWTWPAGAHPEAEVRILPRYRWLVARARTLRSHFATGGDSPRDSRIVTEDTRRAIMSGRGPRNPYASPTDGA